MSVSQLAVLSLGAVLLAGCASGAEARAMVPHADLTPACTDLGELAGAIDLVRVGGGEETSSWGSSKVSDSSLEGAVRAALAERGLAAGDASVARYRLDVFLVELNQPDAGYTTEVVTFIHYTLVSLADDAVAFDDIVTAKFALDYGAVFSGVERLRVVNEGSVRRNIATFLEDLCQRAGSGQLPGTS